jgi:epidermal growth factor receptor substrate 15
LKHQQTTLDKQLQETGQPEAYRNLLARDVPQVKAAAHVAAAILPSIGNGFELVSTPAPTRTANIPVGLKAPTGLVYRVQVGAFANPIREDLFREFTPVTGDKLDNGITRYMAGYFGNRDRASDAQRQIRTLGYKDAFVVAYCDGNRISLAEAKRLEDLGLCVPKNQDSLLLEIVENTLAQLPADSAEKLRPVVRPSDYNKAPGAAVAEAAEEHKGLYYTIQVGVYNRPATAEQVRNIEPLVTKRLENGQIRYSSGMFPGIDAARPKKAEAVARGISDAFVTAYYNGERISLDEAKRILSEQGPAALEKEMTPIRPDAIEKAEQYAVTKPVVPASKEERIQFVSKETYESYPRETIARLNSHGSFYYDTEDQRIKSVEYVPKSALSMLDDLSDELDTVKTVKNAVHDEPMVVKVVAVWESAEISGATADWILRLTQAHTGTVKGDGFELTFENILPEDREDLVYVLESYGADEVRVEEEKQ